MSTEQKESLKERIDWLEMTGEDPQMLVWLLELRRHREDGWKQRAEAAEAIVADVEEVIGLLAEREWAEHCTKTDTGKRLEEAITELHNEAAPDDQPAPPVFGYMRLVNGRSFEIMEGTQRPPDRSGNGAGPWFAVYRQPPAVDVIADLLNMGYLRTEFNRWMTEDLQCVVGSSDPYPAGIEARNWNAWKACRAAILKKNEESKQ